MRNSEIRKLLIEYRDIIDKLKLNNVIRTSNVVAGYGEYIASKKLGLKRVSNPTNKGYDAEDKRGKKYEIKTRKAVAWNQPSLFPANPKKLKLADFLICIEFDNDWNLVNLLKIPRNKVKPNRGGKIHISKELVKKFSVL